MALIQLLSMKKFYNQDARVAHFLFPRDTSTNLNECLGPAVYVPDSDRNWSQNYFQLLKSPI